MAEQRFCVSSVSQLQEETSNTVTDVVFHVSQSFVDKVLEVP